MRQIGCIMVFDSKIVSSDIQGLQVLATDNEGLPVWVLEIVKKHGRILLIFFEYSGRCNLWTIDNVN